MRKFPELAFYAYMQVTRCWPSLPLRLGPKHPPRLPNISISVAGGLHGADVDDALFLPSCF